jgi:hypothetical protein
LSRVFLSVLTCAALPALLIGGTVSAQTVTGVVRDSAGRPLVEAEVIIEPAGARVRTDSAGRYVLRFVRSGPSVLRVRLVGFRLFEGPLRVPGSGSVRRDVRLSRLPQRLATVRVTDRSGCATTALSGFECRRDSGVGFFRDAGELRGMRPRYWSDMLDGMPGLRREMRPGPHGQDWRPAAPPSRCVRELWNGQPPMDAGAEAPFQPDEFWKPDDVVAIEYYQEHKDVPAAYQRYAWHPPIGGQPCGLIIYWLRGAKRTP